MARFLIEVPHEGNKDACMQAVQSFMSTGSHFMTHADWGCPDEEHKAWFTVEVESKKEALAILPPYFRKDAKIIRLQKFAMEDIEEILEQHNG